MTGALILGFGLSAPNALSTWFAAKESKEADDSLMCQQSTFVFGFSLSFGFHWFFLILRMPAV